MCRQFVCTSIITSLLSGGGWRQITRCDLDHLDFAPAADRAKQANAANLNATSLLRRLFDRMSHPAAEHRLGAALALAHCARVIRDESDLRSDFTLEE